MIHQGLVRMSSNILAKEFRICALTYGAEVCVFCNVLSNTKVGGRQRHDEQQSISGLLTDRTLSEGEEKFSDGYPSFK